MVAPNESLKTMRTRGTRLTRNKFANAGFTLIEVLVSVGIFAVAVLGVAMGAKMVIQNNQNNYFTTIAVGLAQDKLEDLKSNPTGLASGGPLTDTVDGETFTRNWTVTSSSPVSGVTRIDVTVTWSAYGSARTITISSAIQG